MPLKRQSLSPAFQNAFFRMALILLLLMPCCFITLRAAMASSGPPQPSMGLGGADYIHSKVISNSYGSGASKYYIFEPDLPEPVIAPLILFLHGWGVTNPAAYSAWIEHIVKKGNIVVFPIYESSTSMPRDYITLATRSVLSSIAILKTKNHVTPDLNKFAIAGHSYGGILAANISAIAAESGLPVPKAIMPVEPKCLKILPLEDLSKIPADALLLTVAGDQDFVAGDGYARKIFYQTPQIPLERKDFIIMSSDYYGSPPLKAGHFTPSGRSSNTEPPLNDAPDALDYYCLWKLFEALTDAAFYGRNWESALGNTPQQRYMGRWSDGMPVRELIVTDQP